MDEEFLEVEEAESNEQLKSIIGALRAAAPTWKFEQINFVVGNCGSVVGSNFCKKLEKLTKLEKLPKLEKLTYMTKYVT